MRRAVAILGLAGLCVAARAVPPREVEGPPTPEQYADGEALAERLRDSAPTEGSDLRGKLIIEANDATREIPITCRIVLHDTNWETIYATASTGEAAAESLSVVHNTNQANVYLYARAASPTAALPDPQPVPEGEANIPLAGSDFSLTDLGLDFLHWPGQRQVKGEMRLGQPCYVLESSITNRDGIRRVRSDIDKESGGLLIAEARDGEGHLLKTFSLHASSFKKVNGHWKVEKMQITDKKTGSDTVIKFDFPK